jgi:ATP-binding cassette subfamily B protein
VATVVDRPARMVLFAVRRAPGWSAALVLSSLAGTAVVVLLPAALARAVDAVLAGTPARTAPALLALAALLGTAVLAEMIGGWAGSAAGTSVELSLRRLLTRRVLLAGVPGARRFAAGDLSSRLVSGTAQAAGVVPTLLGVVDMVVVSAGGLVALALIDWHLAIAFVVCVPVATVLVTRFVTEATGLLTRYQELQGALSARLVEALSGARTIRASGTVEREVDRVLAPLADLTAAGKATWDAQRRTVWKVGLLAPLTEVVVLGVAGVGVATGRITPGSWIAVAGYVVMALGLLNVVDSLLGFARIRAGMARLGEVLALPDGPGGTLPLPDGPGAITFRSVCVGDGDGVVLADLDLAIPAGRTVAVVGRSGAGKSTLAELAGGLRAPDRGEVLLDGVAVARLRPADLRRAVAYAFERPALLGATVHDTIAYGDPALTRDQVANAAARACADAFVRRLPEGYDTELARAPLSGGEAQRLGLARAMARDRRVLILDDATSNVDTATEAEVTTTLTTGYAGRTRLVVAHRAGTAARADLVVWLDAGRVRATGRHDVLCLDPEYRALFGAGTSTEGEPS